MLSDSHFYALSGRYQRYCASITHLEGVVYDIIHQRSTRGITAADRDILAYMMRAQLKVSSAQGDTFLVSHFIEAPVASPLLWLTANME